MNTITPLQSVSGVGAIGQQQSGKTALPPNLDFGQILTATVAEARSGGRFLLSIGDAHLLAQSDAALQVGQTLKLRLTATQPQIELKIVSSDAMPQLIGKSISLISKNISVTSLVSQLNQQQPAFLSSLSSTSKEALNFFSTNELALADPADPQGGEILKQLINRLGLSMERLLADGKSEKASLTLKSALLEIASSFKNAENVSENTHKILSALEVFQMAQIQLDTSKQFIYPLPLPFLENGFLLVDQDAAKSEGNDQARTPYKFSLHLTMSELGFIRIDFFQAAEGLFIRFHAEDTDKSAFASSFGDELRQSITTPLAGLAFAADAGDPVKYLLKQLFSDGNQVLDTKI